MKRNALLPTGDANGLSAIAADLADQGTSRKPHRLFAVLGVVDCRRVATDADTGLESATVRFRRVEVLLADDLPTAEKLIRRALENRSGETTLPLDLEDEINELFRDMASPQSSVDPDEMPRDPDEDDDGDETGDDSDDDFETDDDDDWEDDGGK